MDLKDVLNSDVKTCEREIEKIVNNFNKRAQLECAREYAYNEMAEGGLTAVDFCKQWVIAFANQYRCRMYDLRDETAVKVCYYIHYDMMGRYWVEERETDPRIKNVKVMLHRTLVQSFTSVILLAAYLECKGYSEGLYEMRDKSRMGECNAFVNSIQNAVGEGEDVIDMISHMPLI